MIAYVGSASTLSDLGVHHRRIPTWVLLDSMLPPHQDHMHEEPSLTRNKTRPDVMSVQLTSEEQRIYCSATCNAVLPSLLTNIKYSCKRRKVWILEAGYSS